MSLLSRRAHPVSSLGGLLTVLEKAREAAHRLILRVASVHVDDKAVAGVLAVILQDALHVEVLVELPIGVAVAHQEELGAACLREQ